MNRTVIAMLLGTMATASAPAATLQKAVDLQKAMLGVWVVDEKARMAASPLYSLSTAEKKKEIEKQMAGMPPTRLEFKAASWGFAGDKLVSFKIMKSGPKSLVLDTTDPILGGKEEITVEYISDSSLRMTMKSQGVPLILNR